MPSRAVIMISVPSGFIGMWGGTIATIPSGFVLCDGNNGTQNLLGRFPQSVPDGGTNPGATGGATSKSLPDEAANQGLATAKITKSGGALYYSSGGGEAPSAGYTIADIRPLHIEMAYIMKT